MYKEVVNGITDSPKFAQGEVQGSGDNLVYAGEKWYKNKDGKYIDEDGNVLEDQNDEDERVLNPNGFEIISHPLSNNIYKLYNNGELYGKGTKGIGLQTSEEEMDKMDTEVFKKLELPPEIRNPKKIIEGEFTTYYVIDEKNKLWAFGSTGTYNRFGLTQEEIESNTGREFVKLDVNGEDVYDVWDKGNFMFVITTDGKLYAAGRNDYAQIGVGNTSSVDEFTKVKFEDSKYESLDFKNIYQILGSSQYGTIIWYNDSKKEKYTDEWYEASKFFVTSTYTISFGNSAVETKDTSLKSFRRIWHDESHGNDIDHTIKYLFVGAAVVMVDKDGKLTWSGYGANNGGIGETSSYSTSPNSPNFIEKEELKDVRFDRVWCSITNYNIIGVDSEGYIWGRSSKNMAVFNEKTEDFKFHKLENPPFNAKEDLKEVKVTGNNIFYLLNDGKVYASGSSSYMGLGQGWSGTLNGFQLITNEKGGGSLPLVETLYGGESNLGPVDVKEHNGQRYTSNFFLGNDKNIYITGNSTMMYMNDTIEKSWVKIADNVKYFSAFGCSYISTDGELFVAGEHSDYLGIGLGEDERVGVFKKVEKFGEEGEYGKAVKVVCDYFNTFVLTEENKLYATGLDSYLGKSTFVGWNENSDQKVYVKILDDIIDFDCYSNNTSTECYRSVVTSEGEVYMWGNNSRGSLGYWPSSDDKVVSKPKKISELNSEFSQKLKEDGGALKVKFRLYRRCFILAKNGTLFVLGREDLDNGQVYEGNCSKYVVSDYIKYTNIKELEEDEKIVDMATINDEKVLIVLTNKGNLYGYGEKNRIGLGSNSTLAEMQKLNLTDVVSITGGPGWFVAVKKDGTVWGTGSNANGVLGRWAGSDRSKGRYQTPSEWVECPELEL